MSSVALDHQGRTEVAGPARSRLSAVQAWGLILIAPYLFVFLVFVLYPVCYGLWLARNPTTYEHLFADPIFARSVVNTLAFLILGINLKMLVALVLSGFFVQSRPWIKWLSVLFILPWAVPSIPTILSFRFMLNPEWGLINSGDLPPHGRGRAELAERAKPRPDARRPGAYLEVPALLDLDPDRRAPRDRERSLQIRLGRRRDLAVRNSAISPGRRCRRSISPAPCSR